MQLLMALMDCKCLQPLGVRLSCQTGQATVEYALVLAAFMFVLVGLAALVHLFDGGTMLAHVLSSASHHMGSGDAGAWGDVLAY